MWESDSEECVWNLKFNHFVFQRSLANVTDIKFKLPLLFISCLRVSHNFFLNVTRGCIKNTSRSQYNNLKWGRKSLIIFLYKLTRERKILLQFNVHSEALKKLIIRRLHKKGRWREIKFQVLHGEQSWIGKEEEKTFQLFRFTFHAAHSALISL